MKIAKIFALVLVICWSVSGLACLTFEYRGIEFRPNCRYPDNDRVEFSWQCRGTVKDTQAMFFANKKKIGVGSFDKGVAIGNFNKICSRSEGRYTNCAISYCHQTLVSRPRH